MLSKHIENVRQKSENYRIMYAFTASILFTGVIASFWAFSFLIPEFNGINNSASVLSAVDNSVDSKELSPTGIVKQEAGNIIDSFFNSIKGLKNKPFMGGQYEVKYNDGALGLVKNDTMVANGTSPETSLVSGTEGKFSTTTGSGITVEVDKVNNTEAELNINAGTGVDDNTVSEVN